MTSNVRPIKSPRRSGVDQPWSEAVAVKIASEEGIEMSDDHWLVIRFLREQFFRKDVPVSARILTSALDEEFSTRGGANFLFELFPLGPVHQGCHIAGLPVPNSSADILFGMAH